MEEIFKQYLPTNAIAYCLHISSKFKFNLDLSFNRKSKFGHYKYWPKTKAHTISINKGLSQPLFLITFIHELAHLQVMEHYGRNAKPHGLEWKRAFKKLMLPILNPDVFENSLLPVLAHHLKNPKASLSADPKLWSHLFSDNSSGAIFLNDIEVGASFTFKKRIFKKVKTRRTRALCYESKTGNNYLIPLLAKIEQVDS